MSQKTLLAIAFLVFLPVAGRAQTTSNRFAPRSDPLPPSAFSYQVTGAAGTATCAYYLDAVFPQGETAGVGPITVRACPNSLSSSNFVRLEWGSVPGALSYNVLETGSSPATGNILLKNTTAEFADDIGQSLTSWTEPASYPISFLTASGSFGQIRPHEDEGDQAFNVKAFGAIGNGVNDDTPAIQQAINDAQNKGGGIVLLPPGKYLISSTLKVNSGGGVTVQGGAIGGGIFAPGPASSFLWRGAANGTMMLITDANQFTQDVGVTDLGFDCNTSAGIGLDLQSIRGSQFRDIGIVNCETEGLHVGVNQTLATASPGNAGSSNNTFQHITVFGNANATGKGIVLDGSSNDDAFLNTFTGVQCNVSKDDCISDQNSDNNVWVGTSASGGSGRVGLHLTCQSGFSGVNMCSRENVYEGLNTGSTGYKQDDDASGNRIKDISLCNGAPTPSTSLVANVAELTTEDCGGKNQGHFLFVNSGRSGNYQTLTTAAAGESLNTLYESGGTKEFVLGMNSLNGFGLYDSNFANWRILAKQGGDLDLNAPSPHSVIAQTTNFVSTHLAQAGSVHDEAGTIAISSNTSASAKFTTAYSNAPICTLTPTASPGSLVWWVTTATGSVTAHLSASGTVTFNYVCVGNPN